MHAIGSTVPALVLVAALAPVAAADDWQMSLTVDNQFALYLGSATEASDYAGGANYWGYTYSFTRAGGPGTDFVYVATASDRTLAQGFIGWFKDVTTGRELVTDATWEVFPAGAYAATNPYLPEEWPSNLMPTQAQLNTAIAYATANNLWVPATTVAGYANGVAPWGTRPGIPESAMWLWHDSGRNGPAPSPLIGSYNHDEFLVFRARGSGGACYANCDGSTVPPILNVGDFTCFLAKFAAGDPAANCDGSTAAPVLNVADFACFLTRVAEGCS
jgi:hypothetical protein